jgi:hypothetical protein
MNDMNYTTIFSRPSWLSLKPESSQNSIKYLKWIFIFLLQMQFFAGVFGQGAALTFDPRLCGLNCTANDFKVVGATLVSNPLDPNSTLMPGCIVGTTVSAYLCLTLENSNGSTRDVLAVTADIFSNNLPAGTLNYCPGLSMSGNTTAIFCVPNPIMWTCGNLLELRNIFAAWSTGAGGTCSMLTAPINAMDFCDVFNPSKCRNVPTNITVATPLSANFSAACGTGANTINFTNATTGGTTPITYAWQFGNPSLGTSIATNPSFTFPNNGTFEVILTATDATSGTPQVSTISKMVNIAALGCCQLNVTCPTFTTTTVYDCQNPIPPPVTTEAAFEALNLS